MSVADRSAGTPPRFGGRLVRSLAPPALKWRYAPPLRRLVRRDLAPTQLWCDCCHLWARRPLTLARETNRAARAQAW